MMRRKKIILTVIVLSVLIIGLTTAAYGCGSDDRSGSQLPAPGREAPDFSLYNLAGEKVSLKDFRGRPVLLNFWATYCPPCRYEMPFIQEVYEDPDWQTSGLVILAVNTGDSRAEVVEFMEDNGLTFEVLLDSATNVAIAYNIRAIPTTLFLDEDGIIHHIDVGAFTSVNAIEERLLELIFEGD
jgi:peroxiredoxin